ncbi:hypothetical protein PSEUBRA_001602 [Kalmanozyma brasiliensis GHG001]|uniref:uncharacterized protein n=1 Tax=Kalmanozyma brasiliensis (strain GHG001) TaxID=1365824 RepID=UPI0028682657|nr:uncharacterized protein PSEUBRA_001602 [Kalmanozyma brasiliensis GHG001]KAF6766971.1 hypothetical protein PSEUBRA_001602 [Kalmanozyma brasiliensis GHG001]
MLIRPSPGRVRALVHAAGRAGRPRPASVLTPRPLRSSPSIRTFHSGPSAARVVRSTTLSTFLRRILTQTTQYLRPAALRPLRSHISQLFSALRTSHLTYRVRSPLLRGALSAFRSTSPSTARANYTQLTQRTISFARGTLSGLGARPCAGPLTLSPLRGGVGLQTTRQFSSGGARVFDNLIVNAPLALRLVGGEVDHKARRGKRAPLAPARASARRTGGMFSGANLQRNALRFATNKAQRVVEKPAVSVCESFPSTQSEADFEGYFHFPQLPLESGTLVCIRLIDPLHVALGGREPTPPTNDPRLFDAAFLLDAQTALEHEHRRYLQAKAVLRVLWGEGWVVESMELGEEVWSMIVIGRAPDEVREVLGRCVGFDFDEWCTFTSSDDEGRKVRQGGLDWSAVHVGQGSSFGLSTPLSSAEQMSTPALSSLEQVSTPSLSSLEEVEEESSPAASLLMSLPSSTGQSGVGSELYDSRSF